MLLCLGIGLAPMTMAQAMSPGEVATAKQAFRVAEKGKLDEAHKLARKAKDPLLAQIVLWMELTRPGADASWESVTAFMKRNPDWPNQAGLRRNAEAKMPADMPYDQVVAWFEKHPPLTLTGVGRYADALMETRASDKAIELIRRRYVTGSFGTTEERDFRQRYVGLLQPSDHAARLDRLLWDGNVEEARPS